MTLVNGLIGVMSGKILFEVLRGALRSLPPEQRRERDQLQFVVTPEAYELLYEEIRSHRTWTWHPVAKEWSGFMGVEIVEEEELPSGTDWELRER